MSTHFIVNLPSSGFTQNNFHFSAYVSVFINAQKYLLLLGLMVLFQLNNKLQRSKNERYLNYQPTGDNWILKCESTKSQETVSVWKNHKWMIQWFLWLPRIWISTFSLLHTLYHSSLIRKIKPLIISYNFLPENITTSNLAVILN